MSEEVMTIDRSAEVREHLDRAYDLLDWEEYEAALRECQSAAELEPDCAEVHNLRGVLLDDSRRLEEAIAAYRLAIRADPAFSDAWENLREAESARLEWLSRGAPAQPDVARRARIHLDQATALIEREEYGGALRECDATLQLTPASGRAHSLRGDVLQQFGMLEKAVANFSLAVRCDSTLTEAWAGLLAAETGLEASLGVSPRPERAADAPEAQDYLDRAYGCLDVADFRGVLRACRGALSLAPDLARAHQLRGTAFDCLGHPREAIGAYRLALHYDPGFQDARENLAEIEQEIEPAPLVAPHPPGEGKRFGVRAASYLIDAVLYWVSNLVVASVVGGVVGVLLYLTDKSLALGYLSSGVAPDWPFNVLGVALFVLYFGLFEWLYGATPGKLVLGMRVIARDGGRCSAKAALVRGLLRYWDAFFFCVPALVTMQAPLYQRVGDKAARTMVVGSKDPAIGERREWGWILVAAGLYLAVAFTGYSLAIFGMLMAAGQL